MKVCDDCAPLAKDLKSRSYGDAELNKAIDAAHKADIGLIAMKTQGSASSFAPRVDPFKEAGFSRHQAVLKAVWKDTRIASAISAMPSGI